MKGPGSGDGKTLAALAAGLCQDAGVHLEIHDGEWVWDAARRVIFVSSQTLDAGGPDYCAGILSREVGHYFLTRQHLFALGMGVPQTEAMDPGWAKIGGAFRETKAANKPMFPEAMRPPADGGDTGDKQADPLGWRPPKTIAGVTDYRSLPASTALLLALDQTRVERWMVERYPGTVPWLRLVGEQPTDIDPGLPSVLQFAKACAMEPSLGWRPPEGLDPAIVDALAITRLARQTYATIGPPTSLEAPAEDLTARYRAEVQPALLVNSWLPERWEQAVRLEAYNAFRLAEAMIFPAAARLMGRDITHLERCLMCDPSALEQARKQMGEKAFRRWLAKAIRTGRGLSGAGTQPAPAWLSRLVRALLDEAIERGRPSALLDRVRGRADDGAPALPPARPLTWRWGKQDAYAEAYRRVGPQVQTLTQHLEQILRPRQRLQERSGYPSGRRVNLRRLMAFEADPRRYAELWNRSTIPDRRSVAVSLLVDLSGSMRNEKAQAALLGTVLLVETLARLDVPFAVNGFQDVLVPLVGFGEGLTPTSRKALSELTQEVKGSRRGGNNQPDYNDDGPCLLDAAKQLLGWSASSRLLIVVSDGAPEGRRSGAEDLTQAVACLADEPLGLVALGLGPGTAHVTRFYADAVADVPIDRFAQEIGRLIERIVLGS